MTVKVHYRITQDRAGIPQDYNGARRFSISEGQAIEALARTEIASDFQIPESAVEICKIED